MIPPLRRALRACAGLLLAAPIAGAQDPAVDPGLLAKAKAIHKRVIKIDTHVDISPAAFRDTTPNYVTGMGSQVDLPKMEDGGMDAIFFSIFVGQQQDFTPQGYKRAYDGDVEKFEAIHHLAEKLAPDRIQIALTAADVRRLHAAGKKAALMGVENGYGIGEDITNVKRFYDYGARYLSLAHNGHNQLSDSNTGEADGVWKWNGVSPLGKQVVAEANRLGIVLDISHPSKESNLWVMENSKAPVMASHSAVRALCRSASRDLDDDLLLALKKNGGVMQTVAFASYVNCESPARVAAFVALNREFGLPEGTRPPGGRGGGGAGAPAPAPAPSCGVGPTTLAATAARGGGGGGGRAGARAGAAGGAGSAGGAAAGGRGGRGGLAQLDSTRLGAYQVRADAIGEKFPPTARATVKDLVDHIQYAVKLIGIEHVGISSDFDGGGGIDGYNNTCESINVTVELVRRGFSEKQIEQLWGGNVLRVMEEVEKTARKLQATKS